MFEDPYIMFAKCFATWLRIKILMGFMIVWSIILMSLTAWQMQSEGGNFANMKFSSKRSYSNFDAAVCENLPYSYLRPFEFSYSSNTTSSDTNSYCPWPTPNSELRISMTVFSIVTLLVLFVKTPFSLLARAFFAIYAFIFFAAFVIDAVAVTVGLDFCNSEFANTSLSADIHAARLSIACVATSYQVIPVFDLVLSCMYFIVYTAWNFTTNLYVEKTPESKSLLKNQA
jgi:hypothetical protein